MLWRGTDRSPGLGVPGRVAEAWAVLRGERLEGTWVGRRVAWLRLDGRCHEMSFLKLR